jgi:Fe2+ or Zn2+ uptake regulation protein
LKRRAPAGFVIHRYSVEMHGLCGDCAKQTES